MKNCRFYDHNHGFRLHFRFSVLLNYQGKFYQIFKKYPTKQDPKNPLKGSKVDENYILFGPPREQLREILKLIIYWKMMAKALKDDLDFIAPDLYGSYKLWNMGLS